MHDFQQFIVFFFGYLKKRIIGYGQGFEKVKDLAVAILIVKRGKYSTSFLNTSFFLLVVSAIIVAPSIADNNPLIASLDLSQSNKTYQAAVLAYNPYDNPLGTVLSDRPPDSPRAYTVNGGDTLATIAQRFNITVDTIKWANNLKSDTIKPGDTLTIPPDTGIIHKVVSGDNIYSIAKKYHVDAQTILNWPYNTFADLENFTVTPGQTIFVPGGTIQDEEKPLPRPVYAQVQAGVKGSSNFIWPTNGTITTYPVSWHMAIDIANSAAPPILASDTGTVVFSGCLNWGYGCHIIIDHGNGYQTLYGHMSRLDVSAGQTVSQGQQIGVMGSTGRSTGTHCHFEIRSGGTLLNPLNFLK